MTSEPGSPHSLDKEAIDYLSRQGIRLTRPAGTLLLRRDEPVMNLSIVLSGEVEVRLTGETGACLSLARLGPGSTFGEMGLATGETASADVLAMEPVTILSYPGVRFFSALGECEPLRRYVLAKLAASLRTTSLEAWKGFQRAHALAVLSKGEECQGNLVAESSRMRRVKKQLEVRAEDTVPYIVSGETGAGKLFAAAFVHSHSALSPEPFVVVDCRKLEAEGSLQILLGASSPGKDGLGLPGYGALHASHRGTLVLRGIDTLNPEAQRALEGALRELDEAGERAFPQVRLAATTRMDPVRLSETGGLEAALWQRLEKSVISIPPLAERRADILPLAKRFLEEFSQGQSLRFTQEAEHAVLSNKYSHGNVEELREAVKLAALIASGGEVREEHVFAGPKQAGGGVEADLSGWRGMRWLLSGKRLESARIISFILFLSVTGLCLGWGSQRIGKLSNGVIWALWEPALILLYLLVGRAWCILCPLAVAGKLAKRIGSLERPPPRWMKKGGAFLAAAGFAAIIVSERALHMTQTPQASALLLLTLAGLAALFAVLYQREAWCRYLCPLGTLGAAFTAPGMFQVRANPAVCGTTCTTHDCFKGTASAPGCPVFHHPLFASDSHACTLCLNCLKVCPHGSARLYGRFPLKAIWTQLGLSGVLAPFSLSVFVLSLWMLASQASQAPPGPLALAAGALFCVVLGSGLSAFLPQLLATDEELGRDAAARAAFAGMVLAWGPLAAYQFANVPALGELALRAREGTWLAGVLPAEGVGMLPLFQTGAIIMAGLLAAVTLGAVEREVSRRGGVPRRWGWWVLRATGMAYLLMALWILAAHAHP